MQLSPCRNWVSLPLKKNDSEASLADVNNEMMHPHFEFVSSIVGSIVVQHTAKQHYFITARADPA